MIQGEEQNQKGSIILPKPQRSNNYKRWNELLKIQEKKWTKKQNTKPKNQNKLDSSIEQWRCIEQWSCSRSGAWELYGGDLGSRQRRMYGDDILKCIDLIFFIWQGSKFEDVSHCWCQWMVDLQWRVGRCNYWKKKIRQRRKIGPPKRRIGPPKR